MRRSKESIGTLGSTHSDLPNSTELYYIKRPYYLGEAQYVDYLSTRFALRVT